MLEKLQFTETEMNTANAGKSETAEELSKQQAITAEQTASLQVVLFLPAQCSCTVGPLGYTMWFAIIGVATMWIWLLQVTRPQASSQGLQSTELN